jgi:AraC-like DNA-binding protein
MPSTDLTLVLPLDEPLEVAWTDAAGDEGEPSTAWASVSGLHTSAAAVHHGRRQRGVQLALTPAAARAFWGVPAAALAGELADLPDVDPGFADLPFRLAEAGSLEACTAVVQRALLRALARREPSPLRPEVGRAMALLTRGAPVADAAEEVGYSRRRLSTLVRDEVGVTPKDYQRLARFATAHRLVRRAALRGRVSLAAVAADAGYADQAHLAREWRGFAGCSPTEWLRREFPIVQDLG